MAEVTDAVAYWAETYRPIKNHIDPNAGWDGELFETYGAELEYVLSIKKENPLRIWTWVDGDGGSYLLQGFHLCNRIGYLITEVPCTTGYEEVMVEEYGDE